VEVTVLQPHGPLDASNYQALIKKAQEVYQEGARYILVDMSAIPHMSSSGIVALHSIALILKGEATAEPEDGWEAMRSIDRARESGLQTHLKLLSPTPKVDRVLDMVGFKEFVAVFTDLDEAVESFT
jgi:anti-anti-sigma regulatory factor